MPFFRLAIPLENRFREIRLHLKRKKKSNLPPENIKMYCFYMKCCSLSVAKIITVKNFSNNDVNQPCFQILMFRYKELSEQECR